MTISNPLPTTRRVMLRGVAFDALTEEQTIAHILRTLDRGRGGWVITSNLDHLRRATRDTGFRGMLEQADLVVADGMPLVWASRLMGDPLPQRVAGSAMTLSLTEAAGQHGRSLFLLGGNPGVAERAAEELTRRCPGVRVVGTYCPPMGFEKDPAQWSVMRSALTRSQPDLVYVALGSPKQEKLIRDLRGVLPTAWWIGVGISLSFVTGDVQRAPAILRKTGLEWAHRLLQEPGRLWRRYLVEGIPFAVWLLLLALWRRWVRTPPGHSAPGPSAT
jgi:N-acetylglucosaminyldiphosphoundecaprenol N-acetyl-beta-D-mannosaminyltransferase